MKGFIMDTTINKNKEELLKKLKQRLEDSWSGFTQVVEEAEEFLEDIKEAEEKEIIDYAETEDLNIFYEDYIDNLKYQAEVLQAETQQAIDKFEGTYNISYMKDEV
tara:strand:- start:885 stop:1202 length:318 start_codon:yes stop_codon:yes gene_type:complete